VQSPTSQYQNASSSAAVEPATATRRALFFDRDGVVNRRIVDGYVRNAEEFEMLPDVLTVLPDVHRAGWRAVLVTNQRGIALGVMTEHDLHALHAWLQQTLFERCGHTFDAIEYCPHHRDAGCDCRKPAPGMLLRAAHAHGIDLANSWMVGDSASDIEAAHRAGCRAVLIAPADTPSEAELVVPSLAEGWAGIRQAERLR